jgi:diguanylate cyclase (GGDEF)-like protein/PAS domain S-box-containing protein
MKQESDKSDFIPPNDLKALQQQVALLEHANAALSEQCQWLRQVADSAPTALYIFDLVAQKLVYLNQGVTDLSGYPVHELLAQGMDALGMLIHPDDQPRLLQDCTRFARAGDGDVIETEYRILHEDGSWRWLVNRERVFLRDADGRPQRILGTAQDITIHKHKEEALRGSERRLTTILESITDAFFALDQEWHFTYVNGEAEKLLRRTRHELIGSYIWDIYPEAVQTIFYTEYHRASETGITVRFDAYFAPFDTWFQVHAYPSAEGLSVFFRDITASRHVQEQNRFQANVLAHMYDAVIATDVLHRITYWNEGAEQLYGFTRDEVVGCSFLTIAGHDGPIDLHDPEAAQSLVDDGTWRGEATHHSKYGKEIIVESAVSVLSDDPTSATGLLAVVRDITRQRRTQDLLHWRSLHDTLTHLPNRLLFLDILGNVIERSTQDEAAQCAVLFLDLDKFQVVNDSMGHMVGDRMLIAVARKIEEACAAHQAHVARFGGDEFLLLLEAVRNTGDATSVAEHIHTVLQAPIVLNRYQRVVTSASIGIALSSPERHDPEELLRDANVAMNHAKRQGGGQTMVFDQEMSARARERLWVETELRQALEQNELQLFYQPVVSLATSKVVGFEVLSRWLHPQRGWIYPGTFIQVAEETGLIGAIDQWVLLVACQQTNAWVQSQQLDPGFTISVNISGREFLSLDLIDKVYRALDESGLDPFRLKLEITETVAMDHAEIAVRMLQQLRSIGVQVALDDFGMGYSSLRYLPRFPIQTIKIDRSFVGTLGQNPESETIVRAIVTMSHSMGLDVVAEGIETHNHRLFLEEMNCDYGQGYLFSRPVPVSEAHILLTRDQTLIGPVDQS